MRVGAIQLNSGEDVDRNIASADRLVRDAASLGAELVALPEKWTVLGKREHMQAGAQTLDGPAITWARERRARARDRPRGRLDVRARGRPRQGGQHQRPRRPRRGDPAGLPQDPLFDVEVDGAVYAESSTEQAGSEIVVTELAGGVKLGMSVCYDLRFPELYRILALRGAEVLAVPSAFTLPTTRDHWEVLVRARAIENQCFVIAPNQIGHHPGNLRSGGRSLIVDPWGLVLAGAPDTREGDRRRAGLSILADVRRRLPTLEHRRPEAYGWGE